MGASLEKFAADLAYGEVGEIVAWRMMWACTDTANVFDVRKNPAFQEVDVDFVWLKQDGTQLYMEVKSDRLAHVTGNFVYETKSNNNTGCLARSWAQYVMYYLSETDKMYLVHLPLLREHIARTRYVEKPMGDNARGFLIPLYRLINEKIAILIK